MKKILYLLITVLTLSFVVSCKDSSSSDDNTSGDIDAPKIISVTPAPDTTELDTIDSVVITYNEPIFRTPVTTIKINDSYYVDSGVVARGNQLIIPINTKGNQTYTITIRKPSVRDSSYNFASDYTLSFSTAAINNFDATQFNITDSLCNPNATSVTKKLYQYLKSQFGHHVLSAAMANVNWNTQEADTMYQMSGKYPAINCFDFVHFISSAPLNPSNWIDYTNITPVKNWWNNGGLVACMWHWNVPDTQADEGKYDKYLLISMPQGQLPQPHHGNIQEQQKIWISLPIIYSLYRLKVFLFFGVLCMRRQVISTVILMEKHGSGGVIEVQQPLKICGNVCSTTSRRRG